MPEWLQAHLPEGGLLVAGLAFIKWLLGREIKRMDTQKADHEARLRRLEETRVTRADMDELRMSLMASFNLVHADLTRSMNTVQADVREITKHLLERK